MITRIWTAAATLIAVFIITGAPAWAQSGTVNDIVVNTTEDLLPEGGTTAATKASINACVKETAELASDPAQIAEDTTNRAIEGDVLPEDEKDSAIEGAVGGQTDGKPDVEFDQFCSFRMALIAARATTQLGVAAGPVFVGGSSSTTDRNRIVFEDIPYGAPINVDEDLGPLPIIDESFLEIDGCGAADKLDKDPGQPAPNKTKPCINIEFPTTDAQPTTDATQAALSLFPRDSVPASLAGLTVIGSFVKIKGIAFQGGAPAIYVPPPPRLAGSVNYASLGFQLQVTNCFFGLKVQEKKPAAVPGPGTGPYVGIHLSGDRAIIGSTTQIGVKQTGTLRNVFAQGAPGFDSSVPTVGVRIVGGTGNEVKGNYFGTDANGEIFPKSENVEPLGIGVQLLGLGADATLAADLIQANRGAVDGVNVPGQGGTEGTVDTALDTTESSGTVTLAQDNEIGSSLDTPASTRRECVSHCNVFASLEKHAIDVGGHALVSGVKEVEPELFLESETVGASGTKIRSNYIGVSRTQRTASADNRSAANGDDAIVVGTGSRKTTIGGNDFESNLISNNDGAGLAVTELAGLDTKFEGNTGSGNDGMLIDLFDDGPGNPSDGVHRGIAAPIITSARPGAISGTGAPDAKITLYLVPGTGHRTERGDIERSLGSVKARSDGTWSSSAAVDGDRLITATAYDADVGTSELARNFRVVKPAEPSNNTGGNTNNTNTQTTPPVQPPQQPQQQPVDREKPKVVTILGKPVPEESSSSKPGAAPPTVVVKSVDKGFSGQTVDNTGVKRVQVAISLGRELTAAPSAVKKAKKKKAKKRAPRCRWVDFKRGRVILRSCAKPLYFTAKGTTKWRLPLNKKTKKLLKGKKKLDMYVKVADVNNNVSTKRYTIKVGRRAVRGS